MPKFASLFASPRGVALLLLLVFCLAPGAFAQKDKKKKKDDSTAAQQAAQSAVNSLPDEQKIDLLISEMLGAWQIGDSEKLHKTIADDVVVVSGTWAPPVFGWANYLASYQTQRARSQQIRLDRTQTFIKVYGDTAWATYQWEFAGIVDGQPMGARGQTTLVLRRQADSWVVVLNHTSVPPGGQPAAAPAAATPPPTSAPKP